ncbi:MAG: alpha/beta fold hydrolase [Actinobacteria bacterium]|uniref:Unannotated protein n=1 Tax=freshwater metagenome TaxID=449393 RepID=A0A6J6RDX0_9ZZZZ|nr:alpha/beta fold hydrolase [Actinomycetota bacterium]
MAEHLTVTTPDGRSLEVLEGGDPGGFPWLFYNGTPTAAVPDPETEEIALRLGLRMISYSRPGYGASTPWPRPGVRVADDVPDAVAVLDHLGVDDFVTLGWSGGGPRALGCAALLPARCRAAATLAGVGPSDAADLDFTAGMAPENVAEFAAAAAGPEAYAALLEEVLPPMAAATPEEIATAMGELVTPVDAAAVTGAFAERLVATFRHAIAQGVVGARDDGLAIMAPWGFDVTAIRVPVAVWQGRQDAMVPFAHGEWLAANVAGARAHLFEDEGHLSLGLRLEEILTDLVGLAGLR